MKSYLNYIALATTASVLLSSCGNSDEEEKVDYKKPQPTAPQHQEAQQKEKYSIPTKEDVIRYCSLNVPSIVVKDAKITVNKPEHGSNEAPTANLPVTVELHFGVKNSLYSYAMPETFASAYKIIDPLLNAIQTPTATDLLNMGADSAMIEILGSTAPSPIPENLQQIRAELSTLCKNACYKPEYVTDATYILTQTFIANKQSDTWDLSLIGDEDNPINIFATLIAADQLPADAPILTPEFIEARQAEIAVKAEEFKKATEECLRSRENALRTEMLTKQTEQNAEAGKQREIQYAQQNWQNFCCETLCQNAEFKGEWKRNKNADKLDLVIEGAEIRGKSLHFYGKVYDILDFEYEPCQLIFVGRCDFEKDAENCSSVVLYIKGGSYDPDKKTKDVFEAADPTFYLKLDEHGSLKGSLTCSKWEDSPKNNFNIQFNRVVKNEPTKAELSEYLSKNLSNMAVDINSVGMLIDSTEERKAGATTDIPVIATITFTPKQDRYSYDIPAEFSESTGIVAPLLLEAQKPGASYLSSMGVDAATIAAMGMTEPTPLPENIAQLNNELGELCKTACYKQVYKAHQSYTVTQKFLASKAGAAWEFKVISGEDKAFTDMASMLPQIALPENAPILNDELVAQRQLEIAKKAEEIKTATETYLREREDALRAELLKHLSAQQPEEQAPQE